ncbi:hypothetical protein [Curtobacterium sp. RRHDQ10]|uniref:hypothetical protein n=1 Tax=Curtobacterium phyllosphaerae TaxID=3413379 RepID=UPI003BF3FF4A
MLRNRLATATVAAVLGAAVLGVTGCAGGTTSPAPSPVRSTDLTSADGGFDEHAVVGVVLAPLDAAGSGATKTGTPIAPGHVETPAEPLDVRFDAAIADAGYVPEVRVADAADPVSSQQRAIDEVVQAGAKVVLVQAVDRTRLGDQVRSAHDAGALVVAIGPRIPGSRASGTGSDYRIASAADAVLVARAVAVVDDLQRGKRPPAA